MTCDAPPAVAAGTGPNVRVTGAFSCACAVVTTTCLASVDLCRRSAGLRPITSSFNSHVKSGLTALT